jgi:hypothetical protein
MLVTIDADIHGPGHPVSPFELDILDDPRLEAVPPAWVDYELPAHAGVTEDALIDQPGLLEQFPARGMRMALADVEAAGHRLPELERSGTLQEQDFAVVAVYDDQD